MIKRIATILALAAALLTALLAGGSLLLATCCPTLSGGDAPTSIQLRLAVSEWLCALIALAALGCAALLIRHLRQQS